MEVDLREHNARDLVCKKGEMRHLLDYNQINDAYRYFTAS